MHHKIVGIILSTTESGTEEARVSLADGSSLEILVYDEKVSGELDLSITLRDKKGVGKRLE
jgi:hypothetical protein